MSNVKQRYKQQIFQTEATNAVCDFFAGQPNSKRNFLIDAGETNVQSLGQINQIGWANEDIRLSDTDLLKNLKAVQARNSNIKSNNAIEHLTSRIEWDDGRKETIKRPVLSIEMETGTGKTYTYIKTMFELHAKYGWSKFIIVVPSIAIREGVAKTLSDTATHFKEEYGKAIRSFIYSSSRLNELESFADDSGINVMVINTQAFNASGKDARRIYMKLDSFRSRRPIDVIAKVRPIIIIDEPQKVLGEEKGQVKKTNATRNSIGKFDPLFYLNYSATHRELFNLVYKLDAVDAYQQKLVKKISVKGISIQGSAATNGYLYLQRINTYTNKTPSATVMFEMNVNQNSGIEKKVRSLSHGDNIYEHSGELEAYRHGFTISNINANEGYVEFTNGTKITCGEVIGESNVDDIRRIQIRETIISHLQRERELFSKGIKVLSLFFIDEVAKYKYYTEGAEQKGVYATIFEEEFTSAREQYLSELPFSQAQEYRKYLERDSAAIIHNGYFSVDKKGQAVPSDVKRGEEGSSDIDAYDLILKNKARLLSLDEPTRFIFSHSALSEGWDNPNVFQICTLRQTNSEITKRQEIGRGLRLCVNQSGERMDADVLGEENVHNLNCLTVIANEKYEDFAKSLQDEFFEAIKGRPTKVDAQLFIGKNILLNGQKTTINQNEAAFIYTSLAISGLVNNDGSLSDLFNSLDQSEKESKLSSILQTTGTDIHLATAEILDIVGSVFDAKKLNSLTEDARKSIKLKLDYKKYDSQEFKDLWASISNKTYYVIKFDENKLVEKSINKLNSELNVTQTTAVVTEGWLATNAENNPEMRKLKGQTITLETISSHSSKYDLLGEIASKTEIKRSTIANILSGIHTQCFGQFKLNPEDFINKVANYINDEKSLLLKEGIDYVKIDENWDAGAIFEDNLAQGVYGSNLSDELNLHLYNRLRYDAETELQFAKDMEISNIIKMYIKMPSSYSVNTPIGTYNPDWAIITEQNGIKHCYFIAETKPSSQVDLHLRPKEAFKIHCAKKHYQAISGDKVKYTVVEDFAEFIAKASVKS
jgi:type III restriction enzyme